MIILLLLGYPDLLSYLNPAPSEQDTETLTGAVIRAQARHPNVRVQLANGEVADLDFPGSFQGIYFARWMPFMHPRASELSLLHGGDASFTIDRPRFAVIPVNPRIWSVRCARLNIPHDEMVAYHRRATAFSAGQGFMVVGAAALILAALIRDIGRRGR